MTTQAPVRYYLWQHVASGEYRLTFVDRREEPIGPLGFPPTPVEIQGQSVWYPLGIVEAPTPWGGLMFR